MNQIDADLCSIPMTVGISPKEWCKTDDVMIKKRLGSHKIRDMRLVQLCDAEFNMSYKQASKRNLKISREKQLNGGRVIRESKTTKSKPTFA